MVVGDIDGVGRQCRTQADDPVDGQGISLRRALAVAIGGSDLDVVVRARRACVGRAAERTGGGVEGDAAGERAGVAPGERRRATARQNRLAVGGVLGAMGRLLVVIEGAGFTSSV